MTMNRFYSRVCVRGIGTHSVGEASSGMLSLLRADSGTMSSLRGGVCIPDLLAEEEDWSSSETKNWFGVWVG